MATWPRVSEVLFQGVALGTFEKLVDHVQRLGVALDHRRNISASELVAIERNQRG